MMSWSVVNAGAMKWVAACLCAGAAATTALVVTSGGGRGSPSGSDESGLRVEVSTGSDAWEVAGRLPADVGMVVVVEEASEMLSSDPGRAMRRMLRESGRFEHTLEAWQALATSAGVSGDELLNRVLGERVLLMTDSVRLDPIPGWALATEVSESTAATLRRALKPSARAILDGLPVLGVEDERFRMVIVKGGFAGEDSGDGRLVVLAPREHSDLLEVLVGALRGEAAASPLSATAGFAASERMGLSELKILAQDVVPGSGADGVGADGAGVGSPSYLAFIARRQPRGWVANVVGTPSAFGLEPGEAGLSLNTSWFWREAEGAELAAAGAFEHGEGAGLASRLMLGAFDLGGATAPVRRLVGPRGLVIVDVPTPPGAAAGSGARGGGSGSGSGLGGGEAGTGLGGGLGGTLGAEICLASPRDAAAPGVWHVETDDRMEALLVELGLRPEGSAERFNGVFPDAARVVAFGAGSDRGGVFGPAGEAGWAFSPDGLGEQWSAAVIDTRGEAVGLAAGRGGSSGEAGDRAAAIAASLAGGGGGARVLSVGVLRPEALSRVLGEGAAGSAEADWIERVWWSMELDANGLVRGRIELEMAVRRWATVGGG